MHQIKEMLKRMGFEIVADEMETIEWSDEGFFVAKRDSIFHRIDYTVVSYGGEPNIVSVKQVEPKQVTKWSTYND